MSQRPDFLRDVVWDQMYPEERSALSLLVRDERVASDRVAELLEEVERHRKLARQLAERSKRLLEELKAVRSARDEEDGRVVARMDDLAATVKSVHRTEAPDDDTSDDGELTYTAPPGTEPPDLKVATYTGDLTPLDD